MTTKSILLSGLFLACLCLFSCKKSSSGEIHGIVTDAETSQPLAGASIVMNNKSDTISTSNDGSFLINDLQAGSYIIQVLKSGYMKKTVNAAVSAEKTSEVSIPLDGSINISDKYLDFGSESTTRNITISKTGSSVMKFSLSSDKSWLEFTPASGDLTGTQTIKITILKPTLSLDIMKGEIVVSSSIGDASEVDKVNVFANGVLDRDLAYYKVVKIGSQTWMAENSHAGVTVASGTVQNDPNVITKYSYNSEYGGLYTFAGMMKTNSSDNKAVGTTQGICPVGWHIPTMSEWSDLIDYIGEPTSGLKLKEAGETHWVAGNKATNESGFTALPGGEWDGNYFQLLRTHGIFWTASDDQSGHYYAIQFEYNAEKGRFLPFTTKEAFSVRCVKNP